MLSGDRRSGGRCMQVTGRHDVRFHEHSEGDRQKHSKIQDLVSVE
jgi:hypothetical protein